MNEGEQFLVRNKDASCFFSSLHHWHFWRSLWNKTIQKWEHYIEQILPITSFTVNPKHFPLMLTVLIRTPACLWLCPKHWSSGLVHCRASGTQPWETGFYSLSAFSPWRTWCLLLVRMMECCWRTSGGSVEDMMWMLYIFYQTFTLKCIQASLTVQSGSVYSGQRCTVDAYGLCGWGLWIGWAGSMYQVQGG